MKLLIIGGFCFFRFEGARVNPSTIGAQFKGGRSWIHVYGILSSLLFELSARILSLSSSRLTKNFHMFSLSITSPHFEYTVNVVLEPSFSHYHLVYHH